MSVVAYPKLSHLYIQEDPTMKMPKNLKQLDADIRTELRKWVTVSEIVTARVVIDTANSNECSHDRVCEGVTHLNGKGFFGTNCGSICGVSDKLQKELNETRLIQGILRTKRHLDLPGDEKVLVSAMSLAMMAKLPFVSNRQFIDIIVEKLVECAMLYTF